MSAFQQDFPVTLEGSALGGHQLLPEALAHLLQGIVGHAHHMELIDHDAGLWQHRLDRCSVGIPHVHADDLDLLPVFHLHQVVGHHVLTAGGQQVEQGPLLDVGQDAAVALVQVQLVNAENAGRLEAVPAPQEFGAGVENVAYRLLVQARNIIKSKLLKTH